LSGQDLASFVHAVPQFSWVPTWIGDILLLLTKRINVNDPAVPGSERRSEMTDDRIHDIPVNDIEIGDKNVRHDPLENDDLRQLADSIKLIGQLQPVMLRGNYGSPPYELIIGQRRFMAIKQILKKKEIKATFSGRISNTDALIKSLAENMCRVELSYKDAADAITELYKHFGRDDRKVVDATGFSLQRVRQYIYIEERASSTTKAKLRQEKVTRVDVHRALRAASDDVVKADKLLDLMGQYKLDGHEKKRAVDYGQSHPRASAEEIIKRAKEPIVERQFLVKLSDKARAALLKAAEKLSMAPDELAAQAVEEWLSSKGFVQ
jgi:ParB/RepB/Spo0J family partition protein